MDIDILLALQEFRNGSDSYLTSFFSKMSYLGELNTVLIIMAVIYWCFSKELGTCLLMGWSGNRLLNGAAKITACTYRPWIRDARIVPYGNYTSTATGYSFPSGHAMNAATIYGSGVRKKNFPVALRVILGLMVVLVAFSRMYLGVHTPQDVLAGTAAGLLVMFLTGKLMRWVEAHPTKDVLIAGIGIALAAVVAAYAIMKSYPEDYDAKGKLLVNGTKMAKDTFRDVGRSAAFLLGWVLERRFVRFSTDIPAMKRTVRLAEGLLSYYAVSLILVPLVKDWFPGTDGIMISAFFQMFYITFLFPWCLKRFETPAPEQKAQNAVF